MVQLFENKQHESNIASLQNTQNQSYIRDISDTHQPNVKNLRNIFVPNQADQKVLHYVPTYNGGSAFVRQNPGQNSVNVAAGGSGPGMHGRGPNNSNQPNESKASDNQFSSEQAPSIARNKAQNLLNHPPSIAYFPNSSNQNFETNSISNHSNVVSELPPSVQQAMQIPVPPSSISLNNHNLNFNHSHQMNSHQHQFSLQPHSQLVSDQSRQLSQHQQAQHQHSSQHPSQHQAQNFQPSHQPPSHQFAHNHPPQNFQQQSTLSSNSHNLTNPTTQTGHTTNSSNTTTYHDPLNLTETLSLSSHVDEMSRHLNNELVLQNESLNHDEMGPPLPAILPMVASGNLPDLNQDGPLFGGDDNLMDDENNFL